MINVTEQVIVPMHSRLVFAGNPHVLKNAQRKRSLVKSDSLEMWKNVISIVEKSEEDQIVQCGSGLKSVNLRIGENSQRHEINVDRNVRLVLKRGQVFHFDINFDSDFHSKVDLTISVINEETSEKLVSLFGSIALFCDDEESQDNFLSMKLNIPFWCSLGHAKMEIIARFLDNNYGKICQQKFNVQGIYVIE